MRKLILHPTEMCQWQAIVNEAQSISQLILNENTESYLVFLLMRYTQGPKLVESVIALDFLHSANQAKHRQIDLLRDVGDKSLLFCGLFPGIAKKRRVSLDYFSDMGQAAYLSISELHEKANADLYLELSSQFLTMRQILQAMRGEYIQINDEDGFIIPVLPL